MSEYTYINLREKPELKNDAAEWFHGKWGVPVEAYRKCMESYLNNETEYGWYLCIDKGRIVGGLGVIENDLGYTKENADSFIQQISDAVTTTAKPYSVSQTQFGIKYKYRIPVTGPNGKTKNVIAVYQIDSGYSIPRLITNYLEGK